MELSEQIVQGFEKGFDLGYRGPHNIQKKSPNLKFVIGDQIELWNKVMKEVKEKRYAGPYDKIPFNNFNPITNRPSAKRSRQKD